MKKLIAHHTFTTHVIEWWYDKETDTHFIKQGVSEEPYNYSIEAAHAYGEAISSISYCRGIFREVSTRPALVDFEDIGELDLPFTIDTSEEET